MSATRPAGCGEGIGDGRTCGARPTRLYPAGERCDPHAPWSTFHGSSGVPPELRGQYCIVPLHRQYRTPDAASWAVIDARAIASGKRRASAQQQAAARAELDRQATARAAAGGRR